MYIWGHKGTRPTGKKIANVLGIKFRSEKVVPGDQILLRWGTATVAGNRSIIQPADAIARAGNKLVSLRAIGAAGVRTPEVVVGGRAPEGVWFGRKMHGTCGRDITIYGVAGEFPGGPVPDFYTRYVPSTREYRVHVFGGEVLGVMGKYLDFPEQDVGGWIKNHDHGYRFRTPARQLHRSRHEAAVKAVEALGLDFGAVDMLIGDDGKEYVLEVNTAPGLAPLTARKYIDAIVKMARERGVNLNPDYNKIGAFA